MKKAILLLLSSIFMITATSRAQCPDKPALLKRIIYFRDTLKPPPKDELVILMPYLDSMNACPDKHDRTHATFYRRIGYLYFKERDFPKSLQHYRQFINILNAIRIKTHSDSVDLAIGHYWLSEIYDSLKMMNEKWRALDNCIDIDEKIKNVDRANLNSLYKRFVYYLDVGEYYRSVSFALRFEILGRQYADAQKGDEHKVGLEYEFVGAILRVGALMYLKKYDSAEVFLINKLNEVKKSGNRKYLGIIYEQLADVHGYKGNYQLALDYLNSALQFSKQDKSGFSYRNVLNTIGKDIYFTHHRDLNKALHYYKLALWVPNAEKDMNPDHAILTLNIMNNIANVYASKGHYDSAFYYFNLASKQVSPKSNVFLNPNSSPSDFLDQDKIYYHINLFIDEANAYREFFKSTNNQEAIIKALRIYKNADKLLDRIKTELTENQSKLYWRGYAHRLYENAIETCYLNNDLTSAMYFFEKSRAVLLFDQLNEQRWLGENDIHKQNELKRNLQTLEQALDTLKSNSAVFNDKQREYFIQKHKLDVLQKQLKTNNPFYFQNYLDTNFITLVSVQENILPYHKALVELFVGDSAVYILSIMSPQSNLTKINKVKYDSLINQFIKYIANHSLLNREYDRFINVSEQLYKLLFSNASLPVGRVIISTDGPHFPFEALVTATRNDKPVYFLEDHAVSYTYSARYLMNTFSAANGAGNNFIGLSPINFGYDLHLANLKGSDQSLDKIGDYFRNPLKLVSGKASRNNFIEQYSDFKIVQLYTHASDSSSRGEPVIWFADSALYLSDLMPEKKPLTRLIVLSACQTGSGRLYRGEGVFSFNRGFAALGIPSAITQLWSVDSKATYELTELFYKHLSEGATSDVALQKAKLEYMANNDQSIPYFWAAAVLTGKAEAIELKNSFAWQWIILAAGIVAILIFTYSKRKATGSKQVLKSNSATSITIR